jgi:hypothetical protein
MVRRIRAGVRLLLRDDETRNCAAVQLTPVRVRVRVVRVRPNLRRHPKANAKNRKHDEAFRRSVPVVVLTARSDLATKRVPSRRRSAVPQVHRAVQQRGVVRKAKAIGVHMRAGKSIVVPAIQVPNTDEVTNAAAHDLDLRNASTVPSTVDQKGITRRAVMVPKAISDMAPRDMDTKGMPSTDPRDMDTKDMPSTDPRDMDTKDMPNMVLKAATVTKRTDRMGAAIKRSRIMDQKGAARVVERRTVPRDTVSIRHTVADTRDSVRVDRTDAGMRGMVSIRHMVAAVGDANTAFNIGMLGAVLRAIIP